MDYSFFYFFLNTIFKNLCFRLDRQIFISSNLTYTHIFNFLHGKLFFLYFFFSTHTDPFIRDHAGVLPLHLAASAGMVSALRLLIKSTVTVGRVPWWKNEQVSCFIEKFIVLLFFGCL